MAQPPVASVVHCAGGLLKPASSFVLSPVPGRSGVSASVSLMVWPSSAVPVGPPSSTASVAFTSTLSGMSDGVSESAGGVVSVVVTWVGVGVGVGVEATGVGVGDGLGAVGVFSADGPGALGVSGVFGTSLGSGRGVDCGP